MGADASTEPKQASRDTGEEFEIVTVSVFMLIKNTGLSGNRWNVKHVTTNELVRPLATPGGEDVIENDLCRDHHTSMLVDARQCTYCNIVGLGACTYPQDQVRWSKWMGQISGLDPSPVKLGPPFADSVLKEVALQAQNPYGESLAPRVLLSKKQKSIGFYRPTRH